MSSLPQVIYLHGFNSSPRSHKAMWLQHRMEQLGLAAQLWVPTIPADPAAAGDYLEQWVCRRRGRPTTLVGSSLGGYYATWLSERHALPVVLINPAVHPYRLMADMLGQHSNPYTGEQYVLTNDYVDALRALEVESIRRPEQFWVLLESGDETLDYREAVEKYRGGRVDVFPGGGHEFLNFPAVVDDILVYCGFQIDTPS